MHHEEINTFLRAHPQWSTNTRDRYRRALALFLADHPAPEDLTPQALAEWLDKPTWGYASRNVALNAIRNYLRWRYGGQHPALAYRLPHTPTPPQRALNGHQIDSLLMSFDTRTPKGTRDLAICALFLDTGLRVSELCRWKLTNLSTEGTVWHGDVLVKGNRWERFSIPPYTASLLASWLAYRPQFAAAGVDNVFVSIGGTTRGHPLTRHGLQAIMRRWAKDAGLPALSPHDLRRTFATELLRNGAPTRIVQVAGRWRNPRMVERYSRTLSADDAVPYSPVTRRIQGD